MAHIENAPQEWTTHDALAHLVHTPIQVSRADPSASSLLGGPWRLPGGPALSGSAPSFPFFPQQTAALVPPPQSPLAMSSVPAWNTGANAQLAEQLWQNELSKQAAAWQPQPTKEDQKDFLPSPERKSAEKDSAYDASASHSVTSDDDLGRHSSPDLVVDSDDNDKESQTTVKEAKEAQKDVVSSSASLIPPSVLAFAPSMEQPQHRDDDASSLLLNFSQNSFTSPSLPSAFSSIDHPVPLSLSTPTLASALAAVTSLANTLAAPPLLTTPISEATFCRPPGLGPAPSTPTSGAGPLVCPICGFSCASKFHYNSHMNTHGDHQCTMCDYTSRTEGRLKKHMRDSHTLEQQLAAGLDVSELQREQHEHKLSVSTMASSSPPPASPIGAIDTLAGLAARLGAVGTEQPSSALEQIKLFTETAQLGGDGSGLAAALGVMSQSMLEQTPEKKEGGRRNSGGKPKTYKCKQCPQISNSKEEQWAHARTHIPVDKQMCCPKCNFVTEYKHHLEYHIRNHIGSKPFQCKKCSYTCVNKSMLNSHMKSHTNVYQFRCMDCTYATKYCHSLKLHLKKYGHRRVPDGEGEHPLPPADLPAPFPLGGLAGLDHINYQMLLSRNLPLDLLGLPAPRPQLKCALCDHVESSHEGLLRHNMSHFLAPQAEVKEEVVEGDEAEQSSANSPASSDGSNKKYGGQVAKGSPDTDYSNATHATPEHEVPMEECTSSPEAVVTSSDDQPQGFKPVNGELNLFQQACLMALQAKQQQQSSPSAFHLQCTHCRMGFEDASLHSVHMSFHSNQPFSCARCGEQCADALAFNLHLFHNRH